MRTARLAIAASLALDLVLGGPSPARAADPDTERARALFEQAGELERRGQWAAAQEHLRSALRLRDTPQLHYALGWALENDDKLLEAKAEYETAARLGRERQGGEEAVRLATARLTELERKMPSIKVRVLGSGKATARVYVDGREVRHEDDGATTSVNPGSHVVRVERSGGGDNEQMVYVGRGSVRTVDVDGGDAPAVTNAPRIRPPRLSLRPSAPPRPSATKEQDSDTMLPWVLVSGGLVLVVVSGAFLLSASDEADIRDSMQARWCNATACTRSSGARSETAEAAGYRQAAVEAGDRVDTKQALGITLGGTGLIAGTIGVLLLLHDDGTEHDRTRRAHTRPRASAGPLPGGGGLATAVFPF